MRVLYVTTELYPALKTGGLADVNASLPKALIARGADVRLLLPGYPALLQATSGLRPIARLHSPFNLPDANILFGTIGSVPTYLICCDTLYTRPGNPYVDEQGRDWRDIHIQFALLSWTAASFSDGTVGGWTPDVIHAHDWHAGLAPAYLAARGGTRPGSLFTVHNLAFQGEFPAELFNELALPAGFYSPNGVEFYGKVNYMKSGLMFADRITTVSPTYAREIQTPEFGAGMDGLLRARAEVITGILNAVDNTVWNPQTDPAIPARFSASDPRGKLQCKAALRSSFELAPCKGPIFCVISRLTEQKGIDVVIEVLPDLIARNAQFVLLGKGDPTLETCLQTLADQFPKSVALRFGYDEALAHSIIAGSDVILVPSRFEPCGLTQMYGLAYGTLPIVHRVGGLADTVRNVTAETLATKTATGFTFKTASAATLRDALMHALELWNHPPQWESVRHTAMSQPSGWDISALRYMELYRALRPIAQ